MFLEGCNDIPVGGYVCAPIIDPKSAPKRDYDKKSLADHFLDYGINFIPGHINVDARVYRLNTYFESGKVRIMECCDGLIKELRDYKFKSNGFEEAGWSNKPEDKNNHGINGLEWNTMELPANPSNLIHGIYNNKGLRVDEIEEDPYKLYDPLSDDDEFGSLSDDGPYEIAYRFGGF